MMSGSDSAPVTATFVPSGEMVRSIMVVVVMYCRIWLAPLPSALA